MQKFIVNDEQAKHLGLYLRKIREKFNYTLKHVAKKTQINTTDIYRLEMGIKTRINPLHLLELSKLYRINIIELYKLLDYINDKSISEYNEFTSTKFGHVEDETRNNQFKITEVYKIPVYFLANQKKTFFDFVPDKHIFFEYTSKEMFGIYHNNITFFFSLTDKFFIENMLIFCAYNEKHFIGTCYEEDNKVVLLPLKEFHTEPLKPIFITMKKKFIIYGIYEFKLYDYFKN